MIRSAVTVSLVPEARGGPFVFWDDLAAACRRAAELKFDAVEVFPPAADAVDPAELRRLLDEHKLALAAVGTGAGWVKHKLQLCDAAPAKRQAARDYIRGIIDFAGPFNAPAIIGSMQGRSGGDIDHDTALAYLREALNDLGEHAKQYDVPLLFEPLNRYESNLANTLEAGVGILDSLETGNVRLLADLFHMNIEEVNIARALRDHGDRVGHVHFVDSNRRAAGFGHIDFPAVAAALHEFGFDGYASAEAFPLPDSDTAARKTIASFQNFLSQDAAAHLQQ